MHTTRQVVSPLYAPAVRFALGSQAVVALFALLALDGGRFARVVGVAMLAFWAAVALLAARRPHAPTAVDLWCVRWGFWPVVIVSAAVQFSA